MSNANRCEETPKDSLRCQREGERGSWKTAPTAAAATTNHAHSFSSNNDNNLLQQQQQQQLQLEQQQQQQKAPEISSHKEDEIFVCCLMKTMCEQGGSTRSAFLGAGRPLRNFCSACSSLCHCPSTGSPMLLPLCCATKVLTLGAAAMHSRASSS